VFATVGAGLSDGRESSATSQPREQPDDKTRAA